MYMKALASLIVILFVFRLANAGIFDRAKRQCGNSCGSSSCGNSCGSSCGNSCGSSSCGNSCGSSCGNPCGSSYGSTYGSNYGSSYGSSCGGSSSCGCQQNTQSGCCLTITVQVAPGQQQQSNCNYQQQNNCCQQQQISCAPQINCAQQTSCGQQTQGCGCGSQIGCGSSQPCTSYSQPLYNQGSNCGGCSVQCSCNGANTGCNNYGGGINQYNPYQGGGIGYGGMSNQMYPPNGMYPNQGYPPQGPYSDSPKGKPPGESPLEGLPTGPLRKALKEPKLIQTLAPPPIHPATIAPKIQQGQQTPVKFMSMSNLTRRPIAVGQKYVQKS